MSQPNDGALLRAADMITAYAELIRRDGATRAEEHHYLPDVEFVATELRSMAAARDNTMALYERAVRLLAGIHALLYPPRFTDNDGRTWQFKSPHPDDQMQELSDRIRALPDDLNRDAI